MQREYDKHHLLFPRQEWDLRPEGERIRGTNSLIPVMKRVDHDRLHTQVPLVPLLGHQVLLAVNRNFRPVQSTLEDINGLSDTIDRISSRPRVHRLERSLALLTMEALDMEKTFLKENGYV